MWHRIIYSVFFSGPIIFIIKCLFFVFVQLWLRWTLPRIRIDQVLYSCIQVMLPLVMALLLLSTFWELLLQYNNPLFNGIAFVIRLVLGVIGLIGAAVMLYIVWYGFSRRRELVSHALAVDLLPGA
jgi:hypothetical protein